MKFCTKCGRQLADESTFCNFCGQAQNNVQQSEYNAQNNYNQASGMNVNSNGMYNQPQNNQYVNYGANQMPAQQYQPPVQPEKKGLKAWQIVLIVLGAVILLGVIVGVVSGISSDSSDGKSSSYNDVGEYENSDDSDDSKSDVSYTKGESKDGVYINEWANIKVAFDDIWGEGSQEEYDSYENLTTECGFISSNSDKTRQMSICFEQLLGVNALLDEAGYLDAVKDGIVDSYEDYDMSADVSEYFETTIAGEEYLACDVDVSDGVLLQRFCVRELDDYMICFVITAESASEIEEKLKMVQTAE